MICSGNSSCIVCTKTDKKKSFEGTESIAISVMGKLIYTRFLPVDVWVSTLLQKVKQLFCNQYHEHLQENYKCTL